MKIYKATVTDAKIWIARGILHLNIELLRSDGKKLSYKIADCYECVHNIMGVLRANMASELVGKTVRLANYKDTTYIGHEVLDLWCSLQGREVKTGFG